MPLKDAGVVFPSFDEVKILLSSGVTRPTSCGMDYSPDVDLDRRRHPRPPPTGIALSSPFSRVCESWPGLVEGRRRPAVRLSVRPSVGGGEKGHPSRGLI